jgi:RecB family endonuclease NucS
VRLVIARCSVDYLGRLTAHLPLATRLLLIKADGSVSIHADDRAYKPLNWMSPPCRLETAPGVWTVTNKAGERLVITLEEIQHDSTHELGPDPGLVKDGVEAHLQQLLAEQIQTLGFGYRLVRREYPTPIGPVDLLVRDPAGLAVAVEIKRRGEIDGVEQLSRYLELLNRDPLLAPVRGVLAAQEINRRPARWRTIGVSTVSCSTMTPCAALTTFLSACFDSFAKEPAPCRPSIRSIRRPAMCWPAFRSTQPTTYRPRCYGPERRRAGGGSSASPAAVSGCAPGVACSSPG